MKRNVFEVPKWHVIQHREQRALPLPSANDSPFRCLEDELYERLYSGGCDRLPEAETNSTVRTWADRIHASCEELPSFGRLSAECRGDPAAAAAAVETLLDELRDLLSPDAPLSPARPGSSKDPLRRPFASACGSTAATAERTTSSRRASRVSCSMAAASSCASSNRSSTSVTSAFTERRISIA